MGPAAEPAAVRWARAEFAGAVVTPLRTRPWADVWRVDAGAERWWLKVNQNATVYEPRLLAVLATLQSSLVPPVRVHPRQPWALIADAGRSAREALAAAGPTEVVAFWCELMGAYAELQRTAPLPDLRTAGVPVLTPDRWVAAFDGLLADRRWFRAAAAPDLTPADHRRIERAREPLAAAAAALSGGRPAALEHDDLHEGNVFLAAPSSAAPRIQIIDWGDAVVGHPFGTWSVTSRALAARLEVSTDHRWVRQVRDAYLEPWRTPGDSPATLERELELVTRAGALVRALSWARALGTPEAGRPLDMSDAVAGWLLRLADAWCGVSGDA